MIESATYKQIVNTTSNGLLYPYPHMHQLEGLKACIPNVAFQLPQELQAITTP